MTDDSISLLFVTLVIKAIAYVCVKRFGIARHGVLVGRVNSRAKAMVAVRALLGLLVAVPTRAVYSSELSASFGELEECRLHRASYVVYASLGDGSEGPLWPSG